MCLAGPGAGASACHSCWSHSPGARPSAARPAPHRPPHTAAGSPAPRSPRSISAARRGAPPSTAPAGGRGWRGSSALVTRYHLQREEEKLVTGASLLELCSDSGYSSFQLFLLSYSDHNWFAAALPPDHLAGPGLGPGTQAWPLHINHHLFSRV